ncbi:renalase [Periophthalmus magnuspinnatus]|uniref:renalase n=1 Tax=Periophthalmus magnuspinnatus TaxID=409849 RepID=UPI00145BC1A5|nr:renalase [Periophthalmus magnuspinnatus]
MLRVLIVGAGLTGSLCACLLKRALQNRVHIQVWDKARGTGGRMSTSRFSECVAADIGAQYVTATEFYKKKHHSLYEELISAGVLVPMSCSVEGLQQKDQSENFISPKGISHIVKHFLQQSEAEVQLQRHVTSVSRRGALWEVEFSEGQSESFDAVVLTMPVPQILQLRGDVSRLLSEQQVALLSQVQYSSRFALVLFFSKNPGLGLDYGLKYVSDNHCIRYISVEHQKRGTDLSDLGPSLVVHTSVSFGSKYVDSDPAHVQTLILDELQRLLPQLPQPISIKTHKWRFSQVLTSVPDCPGHMTVLDQPLLLLGGDAFTHSNFDGCAESALSLLSSLTQRLPPSH